MPSRDAKLAEAVFLVSPVGRGYVAAAVAPFELAAADDSTASAESLDELVPKLLALVDAQSTRTFEAITLKFKLVDRVTPTAPSGTT